MADPALKEKAKEMFVVNGFSMDTIAQVMDGEVSRKTLYNWRKEDNWDEQRREKAAKSQNRRERLESAIDRALDELDVVFDPKLVFAIGKLMAALKSANTFEFTEERAKDDQKKSTEMTERTWDSIDERLGLK